MNLIWEKWFYLGGIGSILAKVVIFGNKWFFSGKIGCIRAKVVLFRQK